MSGHIYRGKVNPPEVQIYTKKSVEKLKEKYEQDRRSNSILGGDVTRHALTAASGVNGAVNQVAEMALKSGVPLKSCYRESKDTIPI